MTLTEEKTLLEFSLAVFLAEMRLNVLGMCRRSTARVLLSSTSSRRTSIVDVKLVLTHIAFHLSAVFVTLRRNCDISMSIL